MSANPSNQNTEMFNNTVSNALQTISRAVRFSGATLTLGMVHGIIPYAKMMEWAVETLTKDYQSLIDQLPEGSLARQSHQLRLNEVADALHPHNEKETAKRFAE